MPFWLSIGLLGLAQAALVAVPRARRRPGWVERLDGPWWALVPAGSILVFVAVVELDSSSATWLSYLALVAVPPLAAFALGALLHGSQAVWALAAIPLFALAWAAPGSLAGEAAATALSGLGCVTLGWLLVCGVPARWLELGVYAMAVVDTAFVTADLLQSPNAVLNAAAPGAGLPALQSVHFGSAVMGFGDLFIAALVGCLLAADGTKSAAASPIVARRQWVAAGLVAALALVFDLLFFAVDELPATVPVAVALALTVRLVTVTRLESSDSALKTGRGPRIRL
jgi:hypothetical protein